MNAKTFHERLNKINNDAWNEVRELIQEAQKDEGMDWDTTKKLSFHDDPSWQYSADGLAELGAWIHDRVRGMNRLDRKSMGKKIRKALGYYP